MSNAKPSHAQAIRLASVWSGILALWSVDGFNTPTDRACIRNGWLVLIGEPHTRPECSGRWQRGSISPDGVRALAAYLGGISQSGDTA